MTYDTGFTTKCDCVRMMDYAEHRRWGKCRECRIEKPNLITKLKDLVSEWREEGDDKIRSWNRTEADDARSRAYERCADALEQVILNEEGRI